MSRLISCSRYARKQSEAFGIALRTASVSALTRDLLAMSEVKLTSEQGQNILNFVHHTPRAKNSSLDRRKKLGLCLINKNKTVVDL